MKTTKLALASLAALGGLAFFATTAAARPDIHVSFRFGAPPPVVHCAPPAPVAYGYYHRPAGYWREIVVKTWVPARWVMSHDRHGRHVRFLEPGYFAYRTDRVWVSFRG